MTQTILIIDDQAPMRKFIGKILAGRGFDLIEAESASQAIEAAHSHQVDLMITDVVMPGGSGISLADSLSAQGLALRVLMISGFGNQAVAGDTRSPARPFLAKPFKPADLLNAVTSLLSAA